MAAVSEDVVEVVVVVVVVFRRREKRSEEDFNLNGKCSARMKTNLRTMLCKAEIEIEL